VFAPEPELELTYVTTTTALLGQSPVPLNVLDAFAPVDGGLKGDVSEME
jgi:hypothetical protein